MNYHFAPDDRPLGAVPETCTITALYVNGVRHDIQPIPVYKDDLITVSGTNDVIVTKPVSNGMLHDTEDLDALYGVIVQLNGINTYPNADEHCRRLYDGCVLLERAGRVISRRVSPDCIVFEPSPG